MTREETACVMARAMGWTFDGPYFWTPDPEYGLDHVRGIDFPTASAPLHDHLAFVGHVAEALGRSNSLALDVFDGWRVAFGPVEYSEASDLSWAAMLAALAVKGAK